MPAVCGHSRPSGPSGELMLGGLPLASLVHDAGTPTYVYDLGAIEAEARALQAAFDDAHHLVAYAVKANDAGPIVRALAAQGCGADVVSGAELALALACGIPPQKIVYSGVAKTDAELTQAISSGPHGIAAIQLESLEEAGRVAARARAAGRSARVSLRINPEVAFEELDTHAHIATGHDEAKFGIPRGQIGDALRAVGEAPELELVGLTVHVGSQFTSVAPYLSAARVLFEVASEALGRGHTLAFLDTGGGFGVDYRGDGGAVPPADFVRAVRKEQRAAGLERIPLHVEPGRALVAPHGVLLAGVIQAKVAGARRWLMIDAGMNDLIRPALYQAHHRIVPLERPTGEGIPWRVVGPVCESSDDFGTHVLPREPPGHVAILDAGAYGYVMASRYNGRPAPPEIFVRDGEVVSRTARGSVEAWIRERLGA